MVIINPFCKRKNRGYGKHHTLEAVAVAMIAPSPLLKADLLKAFMAGSRSSSSAISLTSSQLPTPDFTLQCIKLLGRPWT